MQGRGVSVGTSSRGARFRLVTAAVVILGTLLAVTACRSSGPGPSPGAAGSEPATSTAPGYVSAVAPPSADQAPTMIPTPSTPLAAVTPSDTVVASAGATSCASLAARTYLQVTAAKTAPQGALTLTAHPATMVCGGPDDSHYNVASTAVTGHVLPGATIQSFSISQMRPEPVSAAKLSSYLATDHGTRIFLVTGPVTAITALQEQFHP